MGRRDLGAGIDHRDAGRVQGGQQRVGHARQGAGHHGHLAVVDAVQDVPAAQEVGDDGGLRGGRSGYPDSHLPLRPTGRFAGPVAGGPGQAGSDPRGDRRDGRGHAVADREVDRAAALLDHGAREAAVGTAEPEDRLVAVLHDEQDVGAAAHRRDELRGQRIEVMGVVHGHEAPGADDLAQLRVGGQRVQRGAHQLGGVEGLRHVRLGAPHARPQGHLLFVPAEEARGRHPRRPARRAAEPRQLAGPDPPLERPQQQVAQLAREPDRGQRGAHLFGPVRRPVGQLTEQGLAHQCVVFGAGTQPRRRGVGTGGGEPHHGVGERVDRPYRRVGAHHELRRHPAGGLLEQRGGGRGRTGEHEYAVHPHTAGDRGADHVDDQRGLAAARAAADDPPVLPAGAGGAPVTADEVAETGRPGPAAVGPAGSGGGLGGGGWSGGGRCHGSMRPHDSDIAPPPGVTGPVRRPTVSGGCPRACSAGTRSATRSA